MRTKPKSVNEDLKEIQDALRELFETVHYDREYTEGEYMAATKRWEEEPED